MHLFLFLVFLRVSSRKLPNFFRIIPFPFFPTRGAFTTSSVFPTEHVQQLITLLLPNFFYHNEKHRCPIWSYCLVNNISEGFPKWASIGSRIYIYIYISCQKSTKQMFNLAWIVTKTGGTWVGQTLTAGIDPFTVATWPTSVVRRQWHWQIYPLATMCLGSPMEQRMINPNVSPVSTCLWKRFGSYPLLPTWKIFKLQTNTTWKTLDLYKNQLLIRQPFLSFLESFYFRENQGDGSDSFQEWK